MRKLGTLIDSLRNGEVGALRHHNPYLKESLNLTQQLVTQEELKEKFSSLFIEKDKPLVVEIGCYMGKTLVELAQQNCDKNFFGLDITYKRAVKTARKLQKMNNARVGICDGKIFLQEIVPDHFLQGVCLFFPDPWPKERHKKNRLMQEEFAQILFTKLMPDGFFWLKTDDENYFLESQKILLSAGFVASNKVIDSSVVSVETLQPSFIKGGPYETQFQKIFMSKGIPFYQEVFLKNESTRK